MEKINQPSLENQENKEKITSKIELRFFRHGQIIYKKEGKDPETSFVFDEYVPLGVIDGII